MYICKYYERKKGRNYISRVGKCSCVLFSSFPPYFMTDTGPQGKSMTSSSFMLDGLKYWFKKSPKFHGIGCGKQNYIETKRVGPFKDSPFG